MDVKSKLSFPNNSTGDNFVSSYNLRLTKKLLWMAGQLGSINDTVSITNWATTMALIKNLLWNSPLEQTQEPSFKVKPPANLTRSAPLCISNYATSAPAMSIISVASSNLLPSPSPISPRETNLEHNSLALTNAETTVVNKRPSHHRKLNQPSSPSLHFQNFATIGSSYEYQTIHQCKYCSTNLWFLCTRENLVCHKCKRNPKRSTGEGLFWDCTSCQYLCCLDCLKIRPKKRPK